MAGANARGRLLSALLLSTLVHLLAGGGIPWPMHQSVNPTIPPIDAHLAAPPAPPPVDRPRADTPRPPPAAARPVARATPLARADTPPAAEAAEPPAAAPEPVTAPAPEPPPDEAKAIQPPSPPTAPPPPGPLHPQLPGGFTVRYVVQGNEGGLVLGRLDHVWQRSAERYALFALAKATGIMRLIYSGLLSQTSYGQITPEGLKPENYWMHRGSRQLRVHFDWEAMRADLGERYPPLDLKPGSQDLLSVVYQLALFPHAEGELWVLDGKTIRQYHLETLGLETVEVPLGTVRTRHLRVQAAQGAERIDVWLREAPPHLPLKIHMQGGRDGSAVLMAEAIRGLDTATEWQSENPIETD